MAITIARLLGPLAQRSFWSFRAFHALAGAALSIAGAASGVFINEHIKNQISDIDTQIDDANQRYQDISQALFQFDFTETNAIELGVLAQNDSLMPEFRQQMVDMMFVTREMPTEDVLGQIYRSDPKGFSDARQAYVSLLDAAKAPAAQLADWNAVLACEYAQEMRLDTVQQQMVAGLDRLKEQRRGLESNLDLAIVSGFTFQQLGFVVVVLAGLLYQHRKPESLPLYEIHRGSAEEA